MPTPPDPSTWAALAHRVLSNWRSLLLLLTALAVVAAIVGTMVHLLRLSAVQVGPVVFERVPLINSTSGEAPTRERPLNPWKPVQEDTEAADENGGAPVPIR